MSDLVVSKYHDSEISKVDDFNFTAATVVDFMSSILDGAFEDVTNSFVISGMNVTQLSPASMNVQVSAGLAFSRVEGKFLHTAANVSAPVATAHPVLDRLDTLEARIKTEDFNGESRAFKSPTTGEITYSIVNTRTKVFFEIRCMAGIPGSGAAPAVSAGWMKLAEVLVPAGATQIITANVRGLTAQEDGTENTAWTVNKSVTFNLGSVESIKNTLYAHVRNNTTSINTVHGIRQGHGNGFDADTLDGTHAADAKKVFGEYEAETVTIPDTTDKIIRFTNKQAGKFHTIIETRSPSGTESVEATNSLSAVDEEGRDFVYDRSLHNYSGSMKAVHVLSVFNSYFKSMYQWIFKRKTSGVEGEYGGTEDFYLMQASEDGGLEVNANGVFGPLPVWKKVINQNNTGTILSKMSETGVPNNISGVDGSGSYYADGSAPGLPVAENGLIRHSNNPYSATSRVQEYLSMSNPKNFWIRAIAAGIWTAWRKVLVADDENENYTVPGQLTLSKANGTAPMVVTSSTKVDNLNADMVDGKNSTDFATAAQGIKADNAQPAATAINTGNIGSQTVAVAQLAYKIRTSAPTSPVAGDIWVE